MNLLLWSFEDLNQIFQKFIIVELATEEMITLDVLEMIRLDAQIGSSRFEILEGHKYVWWRKWRFLIDTIYCKIYSSN